jgi:hypothetical protein
MAVLPGVLGCSFDRLPATSLGTGRTGGPCDVRFRYASEPIQRYRGTIAGWPNHLRSLATSIMKDPGMCPESCLCPELVKCQPANPRAWEQEPSLACRSVMACVKRRQGGARRVRETPKLLSSKVPMTSPGSAGNTCRRGCLSGGTFRGMGSHRVSRGTGGTREAHRQPCTGRHGRWGARGDPGVEISARLIYD